MRGSDEGKVRRRGQGTSRAEPLCAGPKATALRNAWHVVPRSVGFLMRFSDEGKVRRRGAGNHRFPG